ncbi:type IV fimbrial biogenesis protein FimT [Psychrobacter sp. PL15]|uniref:pilus assembly FimT family protein n=1 Tax=Psychrobacter sp. PL15 TaxID=3071719 RepID=UPI002DFAC6B3|nr:type IV fimbrial biogenesis protein FimT [Psychrobacter sp. PL15]
MSAPVNSLSYRLTTSSGFTLIELMVTIAVLAIIVSIAAPNISTQLANQRVKSTTATLTNALKEAKVESVIRRQKVTLSYDNTSDPRFITTTGSDGSVIASYSYTSQSTIRPLSVTTIIFEPSKRVTTARTFTICDSNLTATSRQIVVNKVANITIQSGGTCT